MRRFYIWLWLLLLVCGSCTKEKQELSVLHLNIWMEGTVVKNGFEAVADEVARIDPDIVMFSEASNKEGALFVPRMLGRFARKRENLLWTRQFAGCRTAVQIPHTGTNGKHSA